MAAEPMARARAPAPMHGTALAQPGPPSQITTTNPTGANHLERETERQRAGECGGRDPQPSRHRSPTLPSAHPGAAATLSTALGLTAFHDRDLLRCEAHFFVKNLCNDPRERGAESCWSISLQGTRGAPAASRANWVCGCFTPAHPKHPPSHSEGKNRFVCTEKPKPFPWHHLPHFYPLQDGPRAQPDSVPSPTPGWHSPELTEPNPRESTRALCQHGLPQETHS